MANICDNYLTVVFEKEFYTRLIKEEKTMYDTKIIFKPLHSFGYQDYTVVHITDEPSEDITIQIFYDSKWTVDENLMTHLSKVKEIQEFTNDYYEPGQEIIGRVYYHRMNEEHSYDDWYEWIDTYYSDKHGHITRYANLNIPKEHPIHNFLEVDSFIGFKDYEKEIIEEYAEMEYLDSSDYYYVQEYIDCAEYFHIHPNRKLLELVLKYESDDEAYTGQWFPEDRYDEDRDNELSNPNNNG